jgi:hypothetical protein
MADPVTRHVGRPLRPADSGPMRGSSDCPPLGPQADSIPKEVSIQINSGRAEILRQRQTTDRRAGSGRSSGSSGVDCRLHPRKHTAAIAADLAERSDHDWRYHL